MSPARLHCLVPFCRRTRGQRKGEAPITDDMEWICGLHWCRGDQRRKRFLARARRFIRRGKDVDHYRWIAAYHWERAKREAIEAAAGIG